MKTLRSVILLLIASVSLLHAQTLEKKLVTPLTEKLQSIQLEWISMDADTLLDLVIAGVAADGQWKIHPYQNYNTTTYFIKKTPVLSGMKSGSIQIVDWNGDNKMDLIVSGKTLINTDAIFVFTGNGNYSFQKAAQKLLDHSGLFRVGDINNDGLPDLLTYGLSNNTPFIRVFGNTPAGLEQRAQITGVVATDLAIFDMNIDGTNDIIVSGHDLQNKPVTYIYYGQSQFTFVRKQMATPVDGVISLADLNDDGSFDLTALSQSARRTWMNEIDTLKPLPASTGLTGAYLFSGDMTSDGKSDWLMNGNNEAGKRSNTILELSGLSTTLDTTGLIVQRMGDQDRDGDLDLVQVIDSIGSQWLKYYENKSAATNQRPEPVMNAFAVSSFDKTFLFWDPAKDDRTTEASITYDVWLGNASNTLLAPSFDRANGRRAAVKHGNAGTATSLMIRGLLDDRYYYFIQSVDNAYNGSYQLGTGGVLPCFDLAHEDVQACKGGEVALTAGGMATWFSTSKGQLGKSNEFKFVATVADTIFAVVPQQSDCSKNRVYVIHVNDNSPSEKETIYGCKGKTIQLGIESGWSNIIWNLNPPVTSLNSINYIINEPATVIVTAGRNGCTYRKEFTIRLSEPVVTIAGDGFRVLKGTSVQLEGSGTASTWKWTPEQGLSNPTIPNPQATPSVTTEYILTGTDTVGCTATATVQVVVQENAFVPNLFTPNGDGKNDNLMIYGLSPTTKFNFRIFNREGSLVYETKDASQATSVGWNGFVQGTRQPSGIYYWKIDGETSDGDKLLLNGKITGSVLLVH